MQDTTGEQQSYGRIHCGQPQRRDQRIGRDRSINCLSHLKLDSSRNTWRKMCKNFDSWERFRELPHRLNCDVEEAMGDRAPRTS